MPIIRVEMFAGRTEQQKRVLLRELTNAFVNAAVVTGLFPVTGLPMPMISYGGSGTIVNLAVSYAVSRFTPEPPVEVQEIVQNIRLPGEALTK